MRNLYGPDRAAPLPLSCSGSRLIKNSTFYSQTTYRQREKSGYTTMAIILDGTPLPTRQTSAANQ